MKRKMIEKAAIAAIAIVGFASCASNKTLKTVDPERAVVELAPVTRLANQPNQGVYYSLFVRSFADSNGDGIGDFKGIIQKLDYLNDGNDLTTSDLGITGIWLLPIFPSPSYHGYDVDDYYAVNPDYGTMEDFELLIAECKKRGISVIIDMTCNHSSPFNEWFTASRNPDDPHHDWYRWTTKDENKYNINAKYWGHDLFNQDFKYKNQYFSGLFGRQMPDYNLDSPGLRQEFKNVMKFWFDKGVDGFRYDAAGHVYNAAKLPIGSTDSVQRAQNWWKEIIDYNKSIKPNQYSVGEVWENNSIRSKYVYGLDSVFHFDIGEKYIAEQIKYGDAGKNTYANMMEADLSKYAELNPDYIDAPFLSNHDQPRIAGLLKGDIEKCKVAAAMYLMSEGVPFMYYGEEIAMKSGAHDPSKRTPMLWDATTSAGKPKDKNQTTWASDSDCIYNKKTVPVAEMEKDSNSLLNYYKRLIRLRTAHPALYSGRMKPVDAGISEVASWAMNCPTETAFVFHNVSDHSVTVNIPSGYENLPVVFLSSVEGKAEAGIAIIPPYGTVVLAGDN